MHEISSGLLPDRTSAAAFPNVTGSQKPRPDTLVTHQHLPQPEHVAMHQLALGFRAPSPFPAEVVDVNGPDWGGRRVSAGGSVLTWREHVAWPETDSQSSSERQMCCCLSLSACPRVSGSQFLCPSMTASRPTVQASHLPAFRECPRWSHNKTLRPLETQ